ncbi:MAG: polysaccharide lyase family 1 protein [Deltaproteobacteria bacterium]|nr:polysaccharide lyase family 1 protein [Deltaproteobacteria bacterium]
MREAVENADGPVIVRFDVDGVIDLEHVLDLPSDITLDARGRDVTIKTNGLRLDGVSNIVVMNIAFQDVAGETGDAIQILNGASDIVIFHCAFDSAGLMPFVEDVPDELISVVWGATNITVSWCRFSNHDKVLLFGNGDAPPETDEAIAVTLHHNVFTETGRRHPFLRYGRVDMYNNIVRDWTMYLRWPYGTRSEADAQILLEANWYEQSAPWFFVGAYHKSGGAIRLVDNVTTGSWIALWEAEPDAVFHRDYPAPIDLPTPAWYAMLDTYAGNTMPAP